MALGLKTNKVQTDGSTVNGANITGFSAPVMYDKGVSQTPKPRVLTAKFGDGYEMRVRDGINNTPRAWGLTFANKPKIEADDLYTFFNRLASVDTAKLTVPDTNSGSNEDEVVVVIEAYTKAIVYDNYYTISCTAREVFEP